MQIDFLQSLGKRFTVIAECALLIYLQHLCCQQFSCSSSLHEGYDEPEILLNQIVKSVPKALTLDRLRHVDTVSNPGIPTNKHVKKCVLGVFLNRTRIELMCET